jgi:hypothetical protein
METVMSNEAVAVLNPESAYEPMLTLLLKLLQLH